MMWHRRLLPRALVVLLLAVVILEGWRAWRFYSDLDASKSVLLSLSSELQLGSLQMDQPEIDRIQADLDGATSKLDSAQSFANNDPLLFVASQLPFVGKNAKAVKELTHAAHAASNAGASAIQVINDYNSLGSDPSRTSIQEALDFLQREKAPMQNVRLGLTQMQESSNQTSDDLIGPLADAHQKLDDATAKLSALVEGYERAEAFLPQLLGYGSAQSYLLLMQNDTELFPSGGLISNYGIVTFNQGLLQDIQFEYFVNLFDRWQAISNHEYVEPPKPLSDYLLHGTSWGLGEAGWYPNFPTTAQLATDFVEKGGSAAPKGTIAIDLQFVSSVLEVLGPVSVPDYGVTVTAENLSEITLEQTRDESAQPGAPRKAFLSSLANQILSQIFALPRDKWIDMLKVFDSMAKERHLQMYFEDPTLQALGKEYSLDGTIVDPDGGYVLFADTSVHSTKLNLILNTSMDFELQLPYEGPATMTATYQYENPFPEWSKGRDPGLVNALMLEGVYGSFLRLYTPEGSRLRDILVNDKSVGATYIADEFGKKVFGSYLTVLPGETKTVQFSYLTSEVKKLGNISSYSLYVQKEPGTGDPPVKIHLALPDGAEIETLLLDGKPLEDDPTITTDLSVDHQIEVEFRQGN